MTSTLGRSTEDIRVWGVSREERRWSWRGVVNPEGRLQNQADDGCVVSRVTLRTSYTLGSVNSHQLVRNFPCQTLKIRNVSLVVTGS
jgi:hypothetical protein